MSDGELDARAFDDAARAVLRVDELIDDTSEELVDELGGRALTAVRRRRAHHRVTGKGERLIVARSTGSGAERRVRVHAGGRVAHLITGGTRSHLIRPLGARALRVAPAPRGFAGVVRHPGTRADPFVHAGLEDTRHDLRPIAQRAIDELATDVARRIGG